MCVSEWVGGRVRGNETTWLFQLCWSHFPLNPPLVSALLTSFYVFGAKFSFSRWEMKFFWKFFRGEMKKFVLVDTMRLPSIFSPHYTHSHSHTHTHTLPLVLQVLVNITHTPRMPFWLFAPKPEKTFFAHFAWQLLTRATGLGTRRGISNKG